MRGVFGMTLQQHLMAGAAIVAVATASPAMAQTREFNVAAQPASRGIPQFARQAGVQILARGTVVGNRRTNAVRGSYSVEEGLRILLQGTGLVANGSGGTGIITIRAGQPSGEAEAAGAAADSESADAGATPEILVVGRQLTLNADIRRTENDIRPYVVIDRGAIERANATSVEELLRRQLPMQTDALTRSSVEGSGAGNSTRIGLRGLGPDQTLILVDGRRLASRSDRGAAGQPDLGGIPLMAIERIEVLPASASGIYGGGATGGVVNIILRRDYSGLQIDGRYENVAGADAPGFRFDVGAGVNLNGGRTNVLVFASYAEAGALTNAERDLIQRGRERIFENNRAFYINSPPLGSTTNIASTNGSNLVLKPAFGGTTLGSSFTSVPTGYTGPTTDNAAALIARAGQFNFALADTAQPGGGRRYLQQVPTVRSVDATIRHEFSPGFSAFLQVAASRNDSSFLGGPTGSSTFTLAASAPGNPFNQTVRVTIPLPGTDAAFTSRNDSYRVTLGTIFNLPARWRGAVDYIWNRSSFRSTAPFGTLNGGQTPLIASGQINIFSDFVAAGATFTNYLRPEATFGPGRTTLNAIAARFSGPLPLTLPGGEVTASLVLDARDEALLPFRLLIPSSGVDQINQRRSQSARSLYGEIVVPIFSPANAIPLFHRLEFQVAARLDRYKVAGSNTTFAETDPVLRSTTRFSSINPSVGIRWQPIEDITFRASYATGFLPPAMTQVVPEIPQLAPADTFIGMTDPARGDEALGEIEITAGGNPDLRPERSSSWSAGLIFTPRFLQGLRISADWIRITKRDNIQPSLQFFGQDAFLAALAYAPDRFIRSTDPATFGGFAVGPIIAINATALNLSRAEIEAIDFGLDQRIETRTAGAFTLAARATRAIANATQFSPEAPIIDNIDTRDNVVWRGNASLTWEIDRFEITLSANYTDSYFFRTTRMFDINQGSDRIDSQIYFDIFARARLSLVPGLRETEFRAGVRNLLNTRPPFDAGQGGAAGNGFYSPWGDARGASYSIALRQSF